MDDGARRKDLHERLPNLDRCPELGKWDRQHGVERAPKFLLEKYSFDRYGDYHFVPYSGKRGQSHGFSYCYFRRGKTYRLLASLDEAPGLYDFFL